jgi:hypothetical protein
VGKGGQQVGNGHGKVGNVGNPPEGVAHLTSPAKEKEYSCFRPARVDRPADPRHNHQASDPTVTAAPTGPGLQPGA